MDALKKYASLAGIDRAILFTLIARGWRFVAGPIGLYIIILRFSRVEQGFYYTLNSLLSAQIFFELGLLTVIAQFASHEFAHLRWGEDGEILGDPVAKERFADLLYLSNNWYLVASVILVIVLIPAGLLFLNQAQATTDFAWKLPWILAVLSVGANLLIIPFYAVITGSGKVATINFLELLGGIGGTLLSWAVMLLNGGLYAAAAVGLGNFLVGALYIASRKRRLLQALIHRFRYRRSGHETKVIWSTEIWPMQWRIAMSWMSGYFIFQMFTPALFYHQGAVVAGQMGMTLSVVNAMYGVSASWMQTKSPVFGRMIALKQWKELDSLFGATLKQSSVVISAGSLLVVAVIFALQLLHPVGTRFLPVGQVALLMASICCNVLISGLAVYMRAFRKEPMLGISMTWGFLTGISTIVFSRFSSFWVCAGYLAVSFVFALPATYGKWKKFRRECIEPGQPGPLGQVAR
jgi:hypothetical protein